MLYKNKLTDIPLKVTSQTFVDSPKCLEEVNIDDIIYDLDHGIKYINNLHLYHSMRILCVTLQDIIALQGDRTLFNEFRRQQLAKYDINVDANVLDNTNGTINLKVDDPSSESDISRSSTPVLLTSSTEDISIIDDMIHEKRALNPKTFCDDYEGSKDSEQHFIPIEDLVKAATLEKVEYPITFHCIPRIQEEFNYANHFKMSNQTAHLLKVFNLLQPPSLSIEEFLIRIKTYSPSVSISSYVHAAYTMFKLCILLDMIPLTNLNVYRFILGSIRCSTKSLEDIYQKQGPFATVGGVSKKILYKIELGFLYLCNFKLLIGEDMMNHFLKTHLVDLRDFCKNNFNNSI